MFGPNIAISYFFLIPVTLAAHYNGRFLGIMLALMLSLARFCFHFVWDNPLSLWDSVLNAIIRIVILVGAAYLIDRVNRQAQEIKILRGILPICMYCKKSARKNSSGSRWRPTSPNVPKPSSATLSVQIVARSIMPICWAAMKTPRQNHPNRHLLQSD